MGEIIKSLIRQIFPGLASTASAGLLNRVFGLSKAENQQNAFNANEAQKNREFQAMQSQNQNAFNAEQAQINRDFQASQAATQYQRGVVDMQAAGLNPALAYGQGGTSAMSGSAASSAGLPSGSAASGSGRGLGVSLSDLMQIAKMKADIDETKSRTDLNLKQGGLFDAEKDYKLQEIRFYQPLSEAKLAEAQSLLRTQEVERRLKEQGISESRAQTLLLEKQGLSLSISTRYQEELNKLEVRQRMAQIGLTYAETATQRKRVEQINAEINETMQRAILEAAQAGMIDQQTRNLLIEEGILEYDKEQKKYDVDHKVLTYTLESIGRVTGAISSAASTFGALGVGSRAFGMVGNFSRNVVGYRPSANSW